MALTVADRHMFTPTMDRTYISALLIGVILNQLEWLTKFLVHKQAVIDSAAYANALSALFVEVLNIVIFKYCKFCN